MGVAFTALAIENVFYTLSVAAMIAAGITALLLRGGLERELRLAAEIGDRPRAGDLRRRDVGADAAAGSAQPRRSRASARMVPALGRPHRIEKVRRLEQEIYTFAARRRGTAGADRRRGADLPRARRARGVRHAVAAARRAALDRHVVHPRNGQPAHHRAVQVHPHAAAGRRTRAATVLVARALGLTQETALDARRSCAADRMLFWQLAGTALLVRHGISTRRILSDEELHQPRPAGLTRPRARTSRRRGAD